MIINIGIDPHLLERTPRSRKDNYLEAALNKLDFLASTADKVIIPGDLFTNCGNSTYFYNRLFHFFNKHLGKFVVMPGNHDMYCRNLNEWDRTTLGSLMYAGVVEVKTEAFELGGRKFGVSLVDKDMSKVEVEGDVLLAHNYFEFSDCPGESLTKEDIRSLNYTYCVLGHDHSPHEDMFIGNSIVYRIGSLTRITSDDYNKERALQYLTYDTVSGEMEKKPLPHKKDSEVFIEGIFNKRKVKSTVDLVKVGQVLDRFNKQSEGGVSLQKTLRKIGTPEKYITRLKYRHELNGVVFN
jgi:exonuclease SbcD